jgi:hypothetical protein
MAKLEEQLDASDDRTRAEIAKNRLTLDRIKILIEENKYLINNIALAAHNAKCSRPCKSIRAVQIHPQNTTLNLMTQ